jgi:hypothetical protein
MGLCGPLCGVSLYGITLPQCTSSVDMRKLIADREARIRVRAEPVNNYVQDQRSYLFHLAVFETLICRIEPPPLRIPE